MNVKRFVAADMRRALELVKQEMGDDAIILSSKRIKSGVEILTSNEAPFEQAKIASSTADSFSSYAVPRSNSKSISERLGLSKSNAEDIFKHPANEDVALHSDDAWSWENTLGSSKADKTKGLYSGKTQQQLAEELEVARRKAEAYDNISFIQQEQANKNKDNMQRGSKDYTRMSSIQENFETNRSALEKELEQLKLKQKILEQQNEQRRLENELRLQEEKLRETEAEALRYDMTESPSIVNPKKSPLDYNETLTSKGFEDKVRESQAHQLEENEKNKVEDSKIEELAEEENFIPPPKFMLCPDGDTPSELDDIAVQKVDANESEEQNSIEETSVQDDRSPNFDQSSSVFASTSPFSTPAYTWTGSDNLNGFFCFPENKKLIDTEEAKIVAICSQEKKSLDSADSSDISEIEDDTAVAETVDGLALVFDKDQVITDLSENEQEKNNVAFDHQWQAIKNEIADMREMLHIQLERISHTETQEKGRKAKSISLSLAIKETVKRRLKGLGLSQKTSEDLVNPIKVKAGLSEAWTEVLATLAHKIPLWEQNVIERGGIYALVGPSGAGKTSLVSKLVTRAVLEKGAKSVSVITLNTPSSDRQQLERLGKLLDVSVSTATDRVSITRALADHCNDHLILIDTNSFQQADNKDQELQQNTVNILSRLPQVDNIVVLPSTGQEKSLRAYIDEFSVLRPIACVLSKLDESLSLGEVLNVVIESGLPVAYVSNGPKIPMDIEQARGHQLVTRAVSLLKKDQSQQQKQQALQKRTVESSTHSMSKIKRQLSA